MIASNYSVATSSLQACVPFTKMTRGNFIILRRSIISCKFWKQIIQSALVVVNLIFLQQVHKLFWIESYLPPDFITAFGTDDSPKACRIKCTGDVTIFQNWSMSFLEQWSTFIRFPIAPSAHNLEEFFSQWNIFSIQPSGTNPSWWHCSVDVIFYLKKDYKNLWILVFLNTSPPVTILSSLWEQLNLF